MCMFILFTLLSVAVRAEHTPGEQDMANTVLVVAEVVVVVVVAGDSHTHTWAVVLGPEPRRTHTPEVVGVAAEEQLAVDILQCR